MFNSGCFLPVFLQTFLYILLGFSSSVVSNFYFSLLWFCFSLFYRYVWVQLVSLFLFFFLIMVEFNWLFRFFSEFLVFPVLLVPPVLLVKLIVVDLLFFCFFFVSSQSSGPFSSSGNQLFQYFCFFSGFLFSSVFDLLYFCCYLFFYCDGSFDSFSTSDSCNSFSTSGCSVSFLFYFHFF